MSSSEAGESDNGLALWAVAESARKVRVPFGIVGRVRGLGECGLLVGGESWLWLLEKARRNKGPKWWSRSKVWGVEGDRLRSGAEDLIGEEDGHSRPALWVL